MTRRPSPRRAAAGKPAAVTSASTARPDSPPGPARAGDPYGLRPSSALLAPGLSLAGLLVIAWISISLLTGHVPFVPTSAGPSGAAPGQQKTPTPSGIVVVPSAPPEDKLLGTIVYAKDGNIWTQDQAGARQLTKDGGDSMPSFSPDGKWILYIHSERKLARYQLNNHPSTSYTLTYPILYRIHPDGTGRDKLTDGLFSSTHGEWFYWLRQPVMSSDGRTIALFSDAPDPTNSNVVLQLFDIKTKNLRRVNVPEVAPLGHQDAAWSPDGSTLLYVKNGRDGARGAPQISRYIRATKKYSALTGPGYASPRYSADGRYVLATKTSALGTDVVILNARNGTEIARLTRDGDSWGAAWSPAGDAIIYLHIDGGVTDLRLMTLSGAPGQWQIQSTIGLTENAGLDGASHPDWFIPADQLPAPNPTPTPSASPSGS
jgi:Tol biopolymer transport system component